MNHAIAYQPRAMRVGLFRPENFVTAYDWTNDKHGNVTPVLHARFATSEGQFDGFAKPFDWRCISQSTTILNEVTGWLVGSSAGLPCAEKAFFIQIPAAGLPSYPSDTTLPPADEHDHLLCFVTQAISNTAVRGLFPTQMLVEEQSEWQHNDHAIAFDEGVGNTDRHIFNLIRRGARDFVLIDHGFLLRVLTEPYPSHWTQGVLEQMTHLALPNILHYNTYPMLGRNSPAACRKGCDKGAAFAHTLRTALRRSAFEISFWSSRLLPGSSARWLHFLHTRMGEEAMAKLLHQRFSLLPLHVRPTV